jgi:hypothetical protein
MKSTGAWKLGIAYGASSFSAGLVVVSEIIENVLAAMQTLFITYYVDLYLRYNNIILGAYITRTVCSNWKQIGFILEK